MYNMNYIVSDRFNSLGAGGGENGQIFFFLQDIVECFCKWLYSKYFTCR